MSLFFNFSSFVVTSSDSIRSAARTFKAFIDTNPDQSKFWVIEDFWNMLKGIGLGDRFADLLSFLAAILILIGLVWIIDKVIVNVSLYFIKRTAAKTASQVDDIFVKNKFFHRLLQLAPLFMIMQLAAKIFSGFSKSMITFVELITQAVIILVTLRLIYSLLNVWNDLYNRKVDEHRRSIKGYIQVAKIILGVIAGIYILATLMQKDPGGLFLGLGTAAALLTLVFKDTILGFVASIQLSVQDMVRIGDWISMPSKNADGTVLDINVNSVKVQNWDNTVTMIPIYSMVSDSFTNWRGMEQSNGRRFVRYFYFNMESIKFADAKYMAKLSSHNVVKDHFEAMCELAQQSSSDEILTNMALFRAHIELFLRNHPDVNETLPLFARYRHEITDKGLGIEIYAFTHGKTSVESEAVQRSLVEYVIASAPLFGISLFQSPSGMDFQRIQRPEL